MPTEWLPSYEYEGDHVVATFEGQVIAEGDQFAKVAATAEAYLESLHKERKTQKREAARKAATHIQTPNGLRGEILSRVEGLWGEEITVRFSNGEIRRMETAPGDAMEYQTKQAQAPTNLREAFQAKLDEQYAPNREGLTARLVELDDVAQEAGKLASAESSIAEQKALHQLALAAQAEQMEIKDVLAHLDAVDAENAAPAAPVYAAVEQADLGQGGNWLEVTAQEMIADSEAQDFDKLLAEGPTTLVAGLDDAAIAHAGTVRELGQTEVTSRTAGFQGEAVEAYREQFVAAVETARRHELKSRGTTARKEASQVAEAIENGSDEGLYL